MSKLSKLQLQAIIQIRNSLNIAKEEICSLGWKVTEEDQKTKITSRDKALGLVMNCQQWIDALIADHHNE